MTTLQAALAGLAIAAILAAATWVASVVRHDVSLVDRMWSLLIAGAGVTYALAMPGPGPRGLWLLALAIAWALRLSLFLAVRNWGHGEDRRYREIRQRNEPGFAFKSLYLVFGLQAVLAWTVSAPLLAGMQGVQQLGWAAAIGIALAVFGIAFEAVGDAQLARFKRDQANTGQVMSTGLWAYTRHPNYFGEACVWWGLWLLAAGSGGWLAIGSVVSPLLMTFLLLRVSGVRLLEHDIGERRPAYSDYIARTNAFFPGPRRTT